jgi:hypothetical protein
MKELTEEAIPTSRWESKSNLSLDHVFSKAHCQIIHQGGDKSSRITKCFLLNP